MIRLMIRLRVSNTNQALLQISSGGQVYLKVVVDEHLNLWQIGIRVELQSGLKIGI